MRPSARCWCRTARPEGRPFRCTPGFAGTLCAKCAIGYKMSVLQTCEPCDTSTTAWSPWLLIPLLLAAVYVAMRKFFTFRREKRHEKLGAAKRLFTALLSSSSGVATSGQASRTELSKQQMLAGMAKLGHTVPDNVAFDLLDAMDIDHSGSINAHEFETWMEHDVSRLKVRPPLPPVAMVLNACRVYPLQLMPVHPCRWC